MYINQQYDIILNVERDKLLYLSNMSVGHSKPSLKHKQTSDMIVEQRLFTETMHEKIVELHGLLK